MTKTPVEPATHTDPSGWLGRWVGTRQSFYLQLMPTARSGHYQLTLRDAYAQPQAYDAWTNSDQTQLNFLRGGQRMTVRAGHGDITGSPTLDALDNCLIVRSDNPTAPPEAFCRRPATADALPLARGAYVQVRQQCWSATRDALLYFDGLGLAHETQQACHASLMRQQGVIFTVAENCTDKTRHKPTTEQQTITVADERQFALQAFGGKTHLYQYCPGKPMPPTTSPRG